MSRNYDNWEKLVGAVLRREKDRQLAYCESVDSSSSADFSSRFSFQISFVGDVHQPQPAPTPDVSSSSIFFSGNVGAIKYEEIRKATRSLSDDNMLKHGLFSSLYKGWMDEHSLTAVKPGFGIPVAFKIKYTVELNDIKLLKKKWIEKISHLRHPNLVTPIGYCFNTDKTIFAYEFMPNGSLDNHLFRNKFRIAINLHKWLGQEPLPWATRIKVAVDAARGLAFLHSLKTPFVYGNLKIEDILLDCELNAKLSNAGLPRAVLIHELEGPVDIAYGDGFPFCAAPEYMETGLVYTKSDVYSFGVVLVQLISGLRAFDRNQAAEMCNLIDWATPYIGNKRRLRQVVMDSRLEGKYPLKQEWKVAQLALLCVSLDPISRPRMP